MSPVVAVVVVTLVVIGRDADSVEELEILVDKDPVAETRTDELAEVLLGKNTDMLVGDDVVDRMTTEELSSIDELETAVTKDPVETLTKVVFDSLKN